MEPYNPLAIANYFIGLAKDEGVRLTHLKLQKLVYFTCGFYMGLTREPLFGERVQAWRYGPVIESLYHVFKAYGRGPVEEQVAIDYGDKYYTPIIDRDDDPAFLDILDTVWSLYGNLSGPQLTNLTHRDGTPWSMMRESMGGDIRRAVPIEDNLMYEYFDNLIKELTDEPKTGSEC